MAIYMASNYSLNTLGAKLCLEASWDLVDKALQPIKGYSQIKLADCGIADGGTTQELWKRILANVRQQNDKAFIEVIFEDLPKNDFNTLATNAALLMEDDKNMTIAMVPRTFYEAICPPNSLDFCFSSTAMHWLSKLPKQLTHHTHVNACQDVEDRALFQAQSQTDWIAILSARAQELKSGGQMVSVNLSTDEQGRYLGNNQIDRNMHDVLHDIWKQMQVEGLIKSEEYQAGTFQNYYRTEAEFIACLEDSQSKVYQAGLRLGDIRTTLIPCPYRSQYENDKNADKFAQGLTQTIRSWSEHTFRNAFVNRSDEEVSDIVDGFYERFTTRVRENPTQYSMDYVETYLRLYKE
ncbi:MAG: SAM-dependent methyltransferase [Cyanobacteria bacterium J06632_19]